MDNSIIALSQHTMETLDLSYGDVVLIGTDRGKETVLIVTPAEDLDHESAQINYVVRRNLDVKLGDVITIHPCRGIKHVSTLPIDFGWNLTLY
jgi:transitional endoplasmic reticulum ATPase